MDEKLTEAYRNEALAAREMSSVECFATNVSGEVDSENDFFEPEEMTYLHARAITEDIERELEKWSRL